MLKALLSCCPIRLVGIDEKTKERIYGFVHKSLYEFFSCRDDIASARNSHNMDTLVTELNRALLWKTEPSVLKLWADEVKSSEPVRDIMFSILELSKCNATVEVAAANAISILNVAGVSLVRNNFAGVQIKGAYLSLANLSGSDFSGSDLTDCSMNRACLQNTILTSSN
jgi:uncharacterized protein YjbI with pentapeptide repeats